MFNPVEVKIEVLDNFGDCSLPSYETEHASGMDLRAVVEMTIKPGERVLVPTGLKMEIPVGYEAQVRPRSGLSLKSGLLVPNSPGTIDADFRGEVKVILLNAGKEDFLIKKGDRIAQLVICPVARATLVVVKELSDTSRGEGGFGHTGVKS